MNDEQIYDSQLLARERWQTFENSGKKNTIFNEHPVYDIANGRKILGIG